MKEHLNMRLERLTQKPPTKTNTRRAPAARTDFAMTGKTMREDLAEKQAKETAATERKQAREAAAKKKEREKIYNEVRAEKLGGHAATPQTSGRIRSNIRVTPPRRAAAAAIDIHCDE